MDVSRRWLLISSGTVLAGGLAGCPSAEDGDSMSTSELPDRTTSTTLPPESITTADTTSTTDDSDNSPTTTPNPDAIRPFAEVRAQPSQDTPGTIFAGLTNQGSTPVEFNYGPRLFLSFRESETVKLIEYRDGLEHRNGCWRRDPDKPTITVIATSRPTRLAPGESVAEEFYVYTPRGVDRCLPAGTYTFKERIAPHFDGEEASQYFVFGLQVDVADDKTLTVETTGPTPDSK